MFPVPVLKSQHPTASLGPNFHTHLQRKIIYNQSRKLPQALSYNIPAYFWVLILQLLRLNLLQPSLKNNSDSLQKEKHLLMLFLLSILNPLPQVLKHLCISLIPSTICFIILLLSSRDMLLHTPLSKASLAAFTAAFVSSIVASILPQLFLR